MPGTGAAGQIASGGCHSVLPRDGKAQLLLSLGRGKPSGVVSGCLWESRLLSVLWFQFEYRIDRVLSEWQLPCCPPGSRGH